ncbi:unnamed protein product [Rodentolepis nana]|uniref:CULLIN_2 domain-containing protein n=1 Tax=Rodentolepis nana TaxID=102285 RepID=A0A0R3TVS0_RODNA|nr:unnamed protein product [Rodentolepis nana]
MWLATWPKEVRSLAKEFLGKFTQINVGSEDILVNQIIKQYVEVFANFVKTRKKTEVLLHRLKARCFDVAAMHGNMQQYECGAILAGKALFY